MAHTQKLIPTNQELVMCKLFVVFASGRMAFWQNIASKMLVSSLALFPLMQIELFFYPDIQLINEAHHYIYIGKWMTVNSHFPRLRSINQ